VALTVIALIIVSIFSPIVSASIVYGPVTFERTGGSPAAVQDNFLLNKINGNYTLYIKNGDGIDNLSSSSLIRLNGETAVKTNEFNQNVHLITKNISVQQTNQLEVEMRSILGSSITLWVEDETPVIRILTPWDDTASNEPVKVSGTVADLKISNLTLNHNGNISVIPVVNRNFSSIVALTDINNITLSAIDSAGTLRSATLLLDGDMLPESYERLLGFDPQNPDSDASLTQENEAGNGIKDGNEMNGGQLPSFVKSRIGADPFKNDTDGDGLTNHFELMKLGLLTDIRSIDSDSDGIPDAEEDLDNDGLTNLQEQSFGTDPLVSDTDKDSLSDGFEINSGTNPLLKDTDNDRLNDDSELRLGTNPLNTDTDGDGILDGDEVYTSIKRDDTPGVSASITGKGDLAKELKIYNVTSTGFMENPALVSPVIDFSLNGTFESATITLPYDASRVDDASNISLFYFNESLGTFVQIPSTVDTANSTVSGITSHFSTFAIFHVPNWNAMFEAEMNMGRGGADVVYVDVMFTLDSSGSMSWNDPSGYRKIAAKNFVGALIPGDRAGVVDFDHYAYLTRPLTSDFNAVNASIDRIDSWGGTNIAAGVWVANNHLINSGNSSHAWMMILLTDGVGYYHPYYTQQAVENNITIYTIGLGYDIDSALLSGIATATGGKYYHVSSADQLPQVFRDISGEIEPTDTDGDGLPDALETGGFRDGLGNWYVTDPNDPDTDGDGLSDGEEAGTLVDVNGRKYFRIISNPMLADSDGDGINDFDEVSYGTDPFNPDTDFDGIPDSIDPEPLIPQTASPGPNALEIGRAIILGAVFGEAGIEGSGMNWLVGDIASSPYYLVGWIGFSIIPVVGAVADIRDAVQAFINGDELGAALNAAGAIPGIGDIAKVSGTIGLFITKYPGKISDSAKALVKYLKYADEATKLNALDTIYDGAATALKKGDITADDIFKVVESNGDIGKTLGIVKRSDGNVIWLEEGLTEAEAKAMGKTPTGWKHVWEKHGIDFDSKFGVSTEDGIQNYIYDSIKYGIKETIPPEFGGGIKYIYEAQPGKKMVTIVGDNGYIVTAYPI